MKPCVFIFSLLIMACNSRSSSEFVKFQDTVSILNCIVSHPSFLAEITPQTQTLVVIKNKYYENNWPEQIGTFNVVYEKEKQVNLPAAETPLIYEVAQLDIHKNTAEVTILYRNKNLLLLYTLLKTSNVWKVDTSKRKNQRT
ncbi:hypothetical protein [Pedobacter nutrimenti]|uniref:hypothetical protein n=1 Tax=Pedobacter nutrimenti TaxID=1241337 RepID=UPI00292CC33F|nr:hypothetical protein [Pedobacter nutrimenti]